MKHGLVKKSAVLGAALLLGGIGALQAQDQPREGAPAGAPAAGARRGGRGPTPEQIAEMTRPMVLPADLTHMPVATFAEACIKCHDELSTRFDKTHYTFTDEQMTAKLTNMFGRARLAPSAEEFHAMGEFAKSSKGGAFVAVKNGKSFAGGGTTLEGEASGGATVVLVKDGAETPVKLEKGAWKLENAPKAPFEVRATTNTLTAAVKFPEAQWAATVNPANIKPAAN